MTKRLEYNFLGLYGAILKDISVYLPHDQVEWDRDFATLTRLTSTRGQPIYTIDLPAVGKILDRSLADGRLDLSGMNLTGPYKPGTKIPRLFKGLWLRLFDDYGHLKNDIDPNIVFFLRTLLYVGKNLDWDCSPRYLFEATKEFYDVDTALPTPSPFWDEPYLDDIIASHSLSGSVSDVIDPGGMFPYGNIVQRAVLTSVQQSADRVSGLLGLFEPEQASFRHGPGAVSDLRTGEFKYDFPGWSERLNRCFDYYSCGSTITGFLEALTPDGVDLDSSEPVSKLIAVPKTQKGPRLIAAEPTAHQWCQQSIRDFLYDSVARSPLGLSLDFENQGLSQEATLLGSQDGSIATIDLKSASDRVSCWLVERIFRRNPGLLFAFACSRTRYIANRIDSKSPSLHKLRKFSTQGSALTFPIQSLIFLSVCLGIGKYLEPKESWEALGRRVRVFGDDLIVPVEWEPLVRASLEVLFLKVNPTKTFTVGYFRESCGMDAWKGNDVTPPHVTYRYQESDPKTIASVVAVSNNFFTKGLWNAASWIQSTVTNRLIPMVTRSSGQFGFVTNGGGRPPPNPKVRWNDLLHQWECRALRISAKNRHTKKDSPACLLQYFTEEPDPYILYESGVAVGGVPVKQHAWVPLHLLG